MDAVVEGIVQSIPGEVLTAAQLQALLGIFAAAAPATAMPPTHSLFHKLSATLATCTTQQDGALCIQLCFLLCSAPAHRETVFAIVETNHARVEALVAPSLAALAASRATSGNGSGSGNAEAVSSAVSGDLQLVTQLVLVLVFAGEGRLRSVDLVEFLGADVAETVQVLAHAYGSVGGILPGVAALFSGAPQLAIMSRLVELLRELSFWTTYEEMHTRLQIGSKAKKALPLSAEAVPMATLAGPYRHHLGQLIASFVASSFLHDVCAYLPEVVAQVAAPSTAPDSAASLMSLVRLHLLLLHSLLTQTDQYTVVLRRTLCHGGFLGRVALPLLAHLSRTTHSSTAHASSMESTMLALLVQVLSVVATLSCNMGEAAVFWAEQGSGALVECVRLCAGNAPAPDAGSNDVGSGGAADARSAAELIAQLVRLVVNARVPAAAPYVLTGWEGRLDDAGRHYVASNLSNPKSRSRPVDITSPAYEALRRVFCLDGRSAPVPAAQYRPGDGGGGGGGGRRQSQGRRGGRGPRSRSRSRQRRRPRHGRRGHRRARMQQRFRLLMQSATAANEVARVTAEEQLTALDVAGDSSSSASSRSSSISNTGDGDTHMDSPTAVGVPPDLSPWRRGAPPPSVPLRYLCALSHFIIRSTPVLSASGYHFDEDVILDYLQHHSVCPVTGVPMTRADLVVDTALKEELHKVRDNFVL